VLIAEITIFLQRLINNLFELGRKIRVEAHRRHGSLTQDGFENCSRAVAAKRERGGGHFVKHDAERKQICTSVEFFCPRLLGRHVRHSSQRAAGAGEMLLADGGRAGIQRVGFAGDNFG
jgi:hypothetical protein